MNPQEILAKIAKLKNAIESESDPDVKATYQKKVSALEAQISEAEKKVEQKEEKAAADEKKELSEAEQKIAKLKAAIAAESDPDVKQRYQKKIDSLQGTLKEVKEEIKEEKKEIAEQKKEIKQAVKEVKSAEKEVRKTAIKKAAVKVTERKKTEVKKTKRKAKLKTIISELDALIAKNKKLKSKYGKEYKGTGKPTDLKRDAARSAKPFGYRFVGKHDYRVPTEQQIRRGLKRGTIDYEARPNRSDVYPEKKVKLADGGMMKKGGKVGYSAEDKARYAKPSGWRWKDSAVEDGIISRRKLSTHPSEKMKKEHPDYVYYEDRLNKADKKPTRTSAPSFKKGGKVGYSAEDKARYAKPAGWRWKEEALTKRIIERKQLSMSPSKKMRDKYPDLVYYEDRLNKADKHPTRTSADSI